ncbi:hypothetical protein BD289DRAFT_450281 [Coniella lustricola]|uniref:Uncharacterized protein n=1 Tax=Coniella lustricola TaxID=2025994 RepID=A0A2T3AJH3_9PEZI|nr:hypothetical protein BD289DRAFT_450281 [Coniella lustricola]
MTTTSSSSIIYTNLPRTILGSLTTTFSAPESCHYNYWVGNLNNPYTAWQGVECVANVVNSMLPAEVCWPPTTQGAPLPTPEFMGWGFYSPGLVCPSGYSSACTATATGAAEWNVQFSMLESETAVGCCPTGFACHNAVSGVQPAQTCTRIFSDTSLTTALCTFAPEVGDGSMIGGEATYPITLTVTTTTHSNLSTITATISALIVSAPMIQINWQPSDLAVASGSTGATGAISSSGSAASTSTSTAGSSNPSSSSAAAAAATGQVSIATLAGAVIGSVLGVALIAGAAFYIWRRKRLAMLGGRGQAAGGSGAQLAELDHAGMAAAAAQRGSQSVAGDQKQPQQQQHWYPHDQQQHSPLHNRHEVYSEPPNAYSELGTDHAMLYELPHDGYSNVRPTPQVSDDVAPSYSK